MHREAYSTTKQRKECNYVGSKACATPLTKPRNAALATSVHRAKEHNSKQSKDMQLKRRMHKRINRIIVCQQKEKCTV